MGKRITYEEVKEFVESLGYKLLSEEYVKAREKLKIQCKENHIFEVSFDNFKNKNTRCKECRKEDLSKRFRTSYTEVKEYIESFGYKLISNEYINAKQKLEVECPFGHRYSVNFHNFKDSNRRCPKCNISKGEAKIMNWLEKNDVNYIYNKPYFKDLLSPLGNPLKPDFILPDYKIWIEYDGEFHYKKMYENDNFEILKIYDELKDEYAKKNNWNLIRIPYWDFDNIEEILLSLHI